MSPSRSHSDALKILLAVAAAALALHAARVWQSLDQIAFDVLTAVTTPPPVELPLVIVGIDEASFGEVGLRWPWPRELHAKLTRELTKAGASRIVFDVVFAEPADAAGDAAFAKAIRESGRVVLAGDISFQETPQFRGLQRVEPLRAFREAGARTGMATIEVDRDQVVRLVPQDAEALWRVAAGPDARPAPGSLIRYQDPSALRYVSYYQALDPAQFLPPRSLEGKIALVGLALKTDVEPDRRRPDSHATPFFRFTGLYTPGVEVHAQLIAGALSGRSLAPLPQSIVWILTAIVLALGAWGMHQWRALRCTLLAAALAAATALAAWLLFLADRWLPAALPVGAIIGLYLARGTTAYLEEARRRRQIRRAFEFYVAPAVVKEMTAHPERLVLGGRRKELTILFTDLAGFTSLSEGIPPEETALVLNEHLTRMVQVVLKHRGTIDKFIGDSVMAFWGAPLDDEAHAQHALDAAIEMQAEMQRWRAGSAAARGLRMRVGINTGMVVVGNMGARDRFDYTAIGDAVNLASRLEGANRFYGTQILLSGETASRAGTAIRLRRVDHMRVKGKQNAIEIFTPAGTDLHGKDEAAIQAYRAARWDEAEALWREVLAIEAQDPIALLYLERIAGYRRTPPPAGWDGTFSLDEK